MSDIIDSLTTTPQARPRLLADIAWAHSGDKGDSINLGVAVRDSRDYPLLLSTITAERVHAHFSDICRGEVRRYELPNLFAVNFVLTRILDGGAMRSLRLDPQGKTLGDSLLLMPLPLEASTERSAGALQQGSEPAAVERPRRRRSDSTNSEPDPGRSKNP